MDVADKKKRLHDMEDYIDALLLRVIECSPRLLQNPYEQNSRRLSSPGHQWDWLKVLDSNFHGSDFPHYNLIHIMTCNPLVHINFNIPNT